MVVPRDVEESLKFTPFLKGSDATEKKVRRMQISPYKVALVVQDVLVIGLAFGLGAFINGHNFFMWEDTAQFGSFFVLSLMIIAFFGSYNLYNYHLIFSWKEHLAGLGKSFTWSLLSLGIVVSLFTWSGLFSNTLFIPIVLMLSIWLMLLRRFLWDQIPNLIESVGLSFLAVGMLALLSGDEAPITREDWLVIPTSFSLAVLMISASRCLLVQVVFNNWMRRHFRRQVAIVGSDQDAKNITNHIIEKKAPFWVAGTVGVQGTSRLEACVPKGCLGELANLPEIVEQNRTDEVIVTDENINRRILISLLDYCTSEKLTVWFPPKLMPIIGMKLYIDNFCGLPMIRLCSQKNSWVFNKIKNGLDALITLPLFLFLLPLFVVISISIKLSSPGPVFYRAKAIGKNGKQFIMYKFRSMKIDNGCDVHKNYVTKLIKGEIRGEGNEGQVFKITDDPRITFVGKLLRKFSLDELPQLINVLKGDMSLVGPRPCLPYEFEVYKDWHKKRLTIRPGISGLWQIAGRSAVTFEDMVMLDLYYIYNRNVLMDMNVLYETIFAIVGKRGAY